MTEEKAIKYLDLKKRILERLCEKKIIPNSEIVSIKDVHEAAEVMIPYNKVLLEGINEEAEQINKKNGFYKMSLKAYKNHLFIRNVDVSLDGNGICTIFVYYTDNNHNRSLVRYSADLNQELGYEYKINMAMSEENESKISHIDFPKYFRAAKRFTEEFPGVPYIWSNKLDNVYNQTVGDGFLHSMVNLDDPTRSFTSLASPAEHELSREKINDGHLFDDYIEMCNKSLAERTAVNINDLNPFLKLVTKKHFGFEEDFTRVRQ